MILLDSNLLIYSVQKEHDALRQWILTIQPSYSIISKVEVLGYWNLSSEQAQAIAAVLSPMREISLTSRQCERAITLRQQRKMSLGDALIAATAIDHELTLATRNTKDFDWISGLTLINPMDG
jgi:predicted nucleic acid-binding protein